MAEEKQQSATERENLLTQISLLIRSSGKAQDSRLESKVNAVQQEMAENNLTFQTARSNYDRSMDAWIDKEKGLLDSILKSRESVKTKLKQDWTVSQLNWETLFYR